MIAHEAVSEHLGIKATECITHDIQKRMPVPVIDKYRLTPIATRGDMIDGAREFNAKWTGHAGKLHSPQAN